MATANQKLLPLDDTDYATPPGETLRELLEEHGMTQRDLARRAGLSPKHINRLLQGTVPLSPDVALRLEHVTGTAARLWNRLEANYRSDLERLRANRDQAECAQWLADMPVRDLVGHGVLPDKPRDKASRVEQLLSFFGVANVEAYQDVYGDMACAFRQSKAHKIKPGSVAAWLRLGELAALDIRCAPFDKAGLQAALPQLRALTVEADDAYGTKMREICAANGVAVVFIEEVKGARTSGVTRWLTPVKALIQLSFRYRTDDHLWFTFFHEIGHVLRHAKTEVWIEGRPDMKGDPREADADQFARNVLIPAKDAARLPSLSTSAGVRQYAASIGIAPGIVVGRLQHDDYWAMSRGNDLKRRVVLASSTEEA